MPPLRARVTDTADLLPPADEARLEAELAAFERETTHQIAVLTVPTLDGEPIETFALRVAESWKLGQKGIDNGILLVVSARDRRARVEVGYGLEGAVPDAVAKRVLEDVMFPHFRNGDMAGGIEAGVQALMRAARGERVAFERRPARSGPHADPLAVLLFSLVIGPLFAAPLFRLGRRPRAVLAALVSGGLCGWWLASFAWAALAFGLGFLLGLVAPAIRSAPGGRGGGFFPGGGFGGGGFGGGGFGGGGFGGGGGGFGGGGASGGW